jgi:hypothetical protein
MAHAAAVLSELQNGASSVSDLVSERKRGKGLKIMAIVDRHGLPLSVSTHAANHHELGSIML